MGYENESSNFTVRNTLNVSVSFRSYSFVHGHTRLATVRINRKIVDIENYRLEK